MCSACQKLLFGVLLGAALTLTACQGNSLNCGVGVSCAGGEGVRACALQAGPDSKNFPLEVQYSADLSGDAKIIELTYQNNAGTQTRDTLVTSWSTEVDLKSGRDVEITADVEATDGSAKITYVARDSTGSVSMTESDQCGVG